jgi:Immunoglobulin-like domain of bacterial spore germination
MNSGRDITSIGGVPVPQHMTRATFPRLLPAIVVHNPVIGAHLSPTVRVTGTSGVFEAAMTAKVLNAAGHRIAAADFLASCGTGCRGRFVVTISYHAATAQNGTVVVTDTSARGGRPPNVVRIPVTLSP